ncbi:hypothetical protein [Celeribacter ethanolicus]|uniref:hypothetical protein n=1 Tax=Celeribacter ethanolicus TaxID=1758178 RepID=UPI000A8A0622|nr:hypothetical protein [Celeribacter ethanolicus]
MTEIGLCEGRDYIVWPLKRGETLSNHDWFPFYGHRFLGSRFLSVSLLKGRREDIGTALILWTEAMSQDPGGTLPDCNMELAGLARFSSVDEWVSVRENVMAGWVPVEVEDEVAGKMITRLGHPGFMQGVVAEMYKRKKGRDGAREAARVAVKKSRLKAKLEEMKGYENVIANPQAIMQLVEYFEHSDLFMTPDNIRAALHEVLGWSGQVRPFPQNGSA